MGMGVRIVVGSTGAGTALRHAQGGQGAERAGPKGPARAVGAMATAAEARISLPTFAPRKCRGCIRSRAFRTLPPDA